MDVLWKLTEHLIEKAARNAAPLLLALGMGLARAIHSWHLSNACGASAVIDPHVAIDVGEIAVFVALAGWAVRHGPLCKRSWPLLTAIGCLSFILCFMNPARHGWPADALNAAGYVGMGLSYALFLLVWLEVAGCLPPVQAVLAIAGSYVVGPVGSLALNSLPGMSGDTAAVTLGIVCSILVVQAYRCVPGGSAPMPFGTNKAKRELSRTIILWVALISLAYGFGDRFAPVDPISPSSKLGMVLPFAVLIAGFVVFRERMDIRTTYLMSVAFMGMGVLSATLSIAPAYVSQTLMSAAHTANLLIACVIACTSARRNRESAVFGCAVLLAVSLVCILAGNFLKTALEYGGVSFDTPVSRITCAFSITAVIILAAWLMHDTDLSSLLTTAPVKYETIPSTGRQSDTSAAPTSKDRACAMMSEALASKDTAMLATAVRAVAEQAGLSKRETAVFELMLSGDNAATISEKLFIAPGTVRAHMSRIYDKLGIHSREEFGRLFS